MFSRLLRLLPLTALFALARFSGFAQAAGQINQSRINQIRMPLYSAIVEPGEPPRLTIERDNEAVFEVPIISGLSSDTQPEKLSAIQYSTRRREDGIYELNATATSTLWSNRRFEWIFFIDHIEFQQFASGHGKLGRNYFLSNGVSDRWGSGSTGGRAWDTSIDADRYFTPNPNHANQFEFNIAVPQTVGFSDGNKSGSEVDFRPERITGIFAPPPLFMAFHLNKTWTGFGIGTRPGEYQFPALEYTGSRYAGASFYVDYLGYRAIDGEFTSPVLSFTFAYDPLDALASYTEWLESRGFATKATAHDVRWHHLPVFCGWAEQTVESTPFGEAPNQLATQANYEKWIAVLEKRDIPFGTLVIDDKWQKNYGTFEVDTQKWPDMKGFVAAQHAKGRHVLLWVPLAQAEGLPESLCIMAKGKCAGADVGKPEYESYLRDRVRSLVADIGVDGFKEDWVDAPSVAGLPLNSSVAGIEFVRRFQWILYTETHKAKPDAMVETQTVNALFRESSDLTRLNDIWYSSRNVPDMMRLRARIAHISGWQTLDTDNASSTDLKEWWSYMQAQPSIGIPALYFITRTESTQESPSDAQWAALSALWHSYIESLPEKF
jgi:Glycosyl hydrolases family 31